MASPFGSSNQGGFRPQQSSQGGFGVQSAGTFGGFQPQQQSFGGQGFGGSQGFGGGQGFGFQPQGFGGGYGGGFNPFQGGYGGGFQPQGFGGGFNPFQGGYGGGFQPQGYGGGFGGFGGGYNPMFGGIGGLGFNPMMGPQFGMPMQGYGGMGGFNPYQQQFQPQQNPFAQQMEQNQRFADQRDQALAPTYQAAQQAIQQNPAYAQLQQLQSQFRSTNPSPAQLKQIHDLQNQIDSDPAVISAKSAAQKAQQQFNPYQQPNQNSSGYAENEVLAQMRAANPNMAQPEMQRMLDMRLQDQALNPDKYQIQQQPMGGYTPQMDTRYRGGPEMSRQADMQNALARQQQELMAGKGGTQQPPISAQDILSMAVGNRAADMQYDMNGDGKITSADALAYHRKQQAAPQMPPQAAQQTLANYRNSPMYSGLGGLGFNPMMGPQFGMPMGRDVAMSNAMIPPQVREMQMQQAQEQNAQREALKSKFGAGIFKNEGRGGGLRYKKDYEQSPELSAFTKTPEYQQAVQLGQYVQSSGPSPVDTAFKNWLYKNKDTLSSGALGFMTEETKAKNAAQDAENARRFALTPEQRSAEDSKMHSQMSQDINRFFQSRGMPYDASALRAPTDLSGLQNSLDAQRALMPMYR